MQTSSVDALLARRGELLAELLVIDQQIGALRPEGVRLCGVCSHPISAERLQAQPSTKTCGKAECRAEHKRRLRRVTAQRHRERVQQASAAV